MSGCKPVHDIKNLIKKSERQDLNLRPLPPQGSTLPSCATSRFRHLYRVVFSWLLALNGSTGKAQRLDRSPSARNPLPRPDFIKFSINYYFFLLYRDDKIRTCDPRDPNTVRYQTALHPDDIRFSNVSHFQKCAATSNETIHRIVSLGRVLHPDILCFALAFLLYHLKKKL